MVPVKTSLMSIDIMHPSYFIYVEPLHQLNGCLQNLVLFDHNRRLSFRRRQIEELAHQVKNFFKSHDDKILQYFQILLVSTDVELQQMW